MYSIIDTSVTKNYIKVDTLCENKVKTKRGPQLLPPYGSLTKATHRVELNLNPLLSTRDKTSHIFPHLQLEVLIYIG